jgi:hypothetical protein
MDSIVIRDISIALMMGNAHPLRRRLAVANMKHYLDHLLVSHAENQER